MRGLGPRIHQSSQEYSKKMDQRVKPGRDNFDLFRIIRAHTMSVESVVALFEERARNSLGRQHPGHR
jgi:hypothetical protein